MINSISRKVTSFNNLDFAISLYQVLKTFQQNHNFHSENGINIYDKVISPDDYKKIITFTHCKFHEKWLQNYSRLETHPDEANDQQKPIFHNLSTITPLFISNYLDQILVESNNLFQKLKDNIIYLPIIKTIDLSLNNIPFKKDEDKIPSVDHETKQLDIFEKNRQKIASSELIPSPIIEISQENDELIKPHVMAVIEAKKNGYCDQISNLIQRYNDLNKDPLLFIPITTGLEHYSSLEKHDCCFFKQENKPELHGKILSIERTKTDSIITFSNLEPKITIKNKNNTAYEGEKKLDTPLHVCIYKIRDDILWAWCYVLAQQMTQRYVKEEDMGPLTNIKLIMIITNVLLDDLAENLKEEEIFKALKKAILYSLKNPDSDFNDNILEDISDKFNTYGKLAIDSWALCMDKIKKLLIDKNITEEVKGLFYEELHAAYENILEAMQKSLELEQGYDKFENIGTNASFDKILSHNMNMIAFEILDRYSSKKQFNSEDVENFKHGCWERIQEMGQIANHISTSTREISEQDYSNPLFWITYQLSNKESWLSEQILAITHPPFQKRLIDEISKNINLHHAREHLYARWLSSRSAITDWQDKNKEISDAFDVDTLIKKADILTCSYLIFKGKL